ncbi:MAG: precorrin-8X methylmutase [Acidimicrobiales bacterium]
MIHPIELESYRILADRVDLAALGHGPLAQAVIARVIHASADLDLAESMRVGEDDAAAGIRALRQGEPVICDVEMVSHGITGATTRCFLSHAAAPTPAPAEPASTRSAAGMRLAAEAHPQGGIWVVGCAPTALVEIIRLAADEHIRPALVIGMPVGFVGAAESKEALRSSGLSAISNVGEKGGSAMAAAALNALVRIAGRSASQAETSRYE